MSALRRLILPVALSCGCALVSSLATASESRGNARTMVELALQHPSPVQGEAYLVVAENAKAPADWVAVLNANRLTVLQAEVETRLWQLGVREKPDLSEKIDFIKRQTRFAAPPEELETLRKLQDARPFSDTTSQLSAIPDITEIDPVTPEDEKQFILERSRESFNEELYRSNQQELLRLVE